MSDANLRERFRQARQKRAQERGSTVSEGGVKRPRQISDELSFVEATSATARHTITNTTETVNSLSKEEQDRILMPPPGPLKKTSRPMTKEHAEKSITMHRHETADDARGDVGSNMAEQHEIQDGVPDDFFEIESQKSKRQLEKERTAQRDDAEYLRFQQELNASMTSITEKEAEEEEESDRHRQEMDDYEQQQRLELVHVFKEKRVHLPSPKPSPQEQPPSTSGEASMDDDLSPSDDEEDIEQLWRGKSF